MLTIRQESPKDYPSVREVNLRAFESPAEADLVEALRRREAVTLSLVADLDGEVVGHILFSSVDIVATRSSFTAVALGPMAVLPGHQDQGIGSRLVWHGLDLLGELGHEVIVVLGHPEYYPRFGFAPAVEFNIRCKYDVPDEVFMVLELEPDALGGRDGVVNYQSEFDEV